MHVPAQFASRRQTSSKITHPATADAGAAERRDDSGRILFGVLRGLRVLARCVRRRVSLGVTMCLLQLVS